VCIPVDAFTTLQDKVGYEPGVGILTGCHGELFVDYNHLCELTM